MSAPRSERRTRTYLTINYDTKDLAKRFGARWDPSRKSWYVLGDVPPVLMGYVSGENVSQSKEKPEAERQKDKARTIAARPKPLLREPPPGDAQADFFVPGVWDVATKDNRGIMDVAVFRLSKKHPRANEVMIHKLPDGHVRVTSGPDGMASIWDYDIVLMGVSHLTEAMNRYRAGLGDKPGRTFRPHVSEILKFCRQSDGGRQYEAVEAALRRLKQTSVEIVRGRKQDRGGRPIRETEGAGLINDYKAVSYEDTGRVVSVEIELPKWLYNAVVVIAQLLDSLSDCVNIQRLDVRARHGSAIRSPGAVIGHALRVSICEPASLSFPDPLLRLWVDRRHDAAIQLVHLLVIGDVGLMRTGRHPCGCFTLRRLEAFVRLRRDGVCGVACKSGRQESRQNDQIRCVFHDVLPWMIFSRRELCARVQACDTSALMASTLYDRSRQSNDSLLAALLLRSGASSY